MSAISSTEHRPAYGPALARSSAVGQNATADGDRYINANREPNVSVNFVHITTYNPPSIIARMHNLASGILDREALKACADASGQHNMLHLAKDGSLTVQNINDVKMHPAIERYINSMADAQARSQYSWFGCLMALLATVSLLWITGAKNTVHSLGEYWKVK